MGMIIQNGKVFSGEPKTTYTERVLWLGPATPTTSGLDITFSDAITNYDEIIFDLISENGRKYQDSFLVSALTIGSTYLEALYSAESQGVFWTYTNETSINIKRITTGSETTITYNKIVGVKHGDVIKKEDYYKYSTDERVVGEWIDGKTLYEKTVSFSTPSSNAYTRVTIASGVEMGFCDTSATFVIGGEQMAFLGTYTSNPNADQFVGLGNLDSSNSLSLDYRVGTGYQNKQGYATFRYTKLSS